MTEARSSEEDKENEHTSLDQMTSRDNLGGSSLAKPSEKQEVKASPGLKLNLGGLKLGGAASNLLGNLKK